jgi:hypothetical protein
VEFIETPIFTAQIRLLISEEKFRLFQNALIENPEAGAMIVGAGGSRKVRWGIDGGGKSGGIRVIYVLRSDRVFLLLAYKKGRKDSLDPNEKKALAKIVKEIR